MTVGQSPTCSFSVSDGREVLFLSPFRAVLGAIRVQVIDRPSPDAPSLTQINNCANGLLKEATGHTCSDQRVHSPLTFAFTEEQSNRAHGSNMQCHSNLWTATCLHCKYFLSCRGDKRKSHGSYIHGAYMQ